MNPGTCFHETLSPSRDGRFHSHVRKTEGSGGKFKNVGFVVKEKTNIGHWPERVAEGRIVRAKARIETKTEVSAMLGDSWD